MLKRINSIEGENVGTKKDLWYARGDHIPVLGHRGIKAKYSENTMVSFKAAIDLGDLLLNVEIRKTVLGLQRFKIQFFESLILAQDERWRRA